MARSIGLVLITLCGGTAGAVDSNRRRLRQQSNDHDQLHDNRHGLKRLRTSISTVGEGDIRGSGGRWLEEEDKAAEDNFDWAISDQQTVAANTKEDEGFNWAETNLLMSLDMMSLDMMSIPLVKELSMSMPPTPPEPICHPSIQEKVLHLSMSMPTEPEALQEVPGCDGNPSSGGADYCACPTGYSAPTGSLFKLGNSLGANAYGLCEGDCDYDTDCKGELICYHRHGAFKPQFTVPTVSYNTDEDIDFFLLSGQSNMHGHTTSGQSLTSNGVYWKEIKSILDAGPPAGGDWKDMRRALFDVIAPANMNNEVAAKLSSETMKLYNRGLLYDLDAPLELGT